jgi:hypothetical protein
MEMLLTPAVQITNKKLVNQILHMNRETKSNFILFLGVMEFNFIISSEISKYFVNIM